ncbi:DEAD/DEAH box helicase family protein [Clostridium sp. Ade.TY]|uniref:DEAD/DEAH box helicase family protein n=1 Tax=Clostridium sp. Ade.TY TaxID=1391647 RepID=UPI00040219B2|nr:DEAD/DEAH box helicase family protein [Clostridium sp. Ade.TY]
MSLVKNKNAGMVKITKGETKRKPYPHQIEAMKALSAEVENKEDYKGLLVLPTGGGKTLTAVQWILKNAINKKSKVLWIAHRHELLDQALKSFIDNSYSNLVPNRTFYNYRIISGKNDRPVNIKSYDDIIIASKDSLRSGIKYLIKNWVKVSKEDIFIVVDEAHHAVAKGYVKILKEVEKEAKGKVRIIGLTATPFRTSEDEKGALKKIFKDDITYGIDLRKLINTEILSQPIFIEEKTKIDMSLDLSLKQLNFIKNSDVLPENIAKFIAENKDRNRFIVDHYIKNKDKYGKTIVFAVNQMNAIALKSIFEKYGVKADYVISGLKSGGTLVSISNEEKDRIIKDFKDGMLDVLINVNILTEGTDIPNTQTVFLARQTTSSILMTQMIGRALRGKKAGGTEKAYVVSFVDDWKDKISWVNPKILIESNYNDDINNPKERNKNIVRLIALKKIEEFAKIIDNTVNTEALEDLPFIERIPVGIYSFSILLNSTNDEHNEKICDILVYDCFKNDLESLINNLNNIFKECNVEEKEYLNDIEVNKLYNLAKSKYLKGSDTSIACNEDDIKDIIIYYSQTGEKPKFMPLEEREKFDISKIAKEIYDKDLGERAKRKYINELWEDENNFLKLFFNGNERLLYDMVNKEISKISFGIDEECIDTIEVNYEDVDERTLDLNKLEEENPDKASELREAVFNKFKDKDGYYHSAISDYKSKNKVIFQIDHIVPISEGGLTELSNLQLLTRWENMKKSNSLDYNTEEKDVDIASDEIIKDKNSNESNKVVKGYNLLDLNNRKVRLIYKKNARKLKKILLKDTINKEIELTFDKLNAYIKIDSLAETEANGTMKDIYLLNDQIEENKLCFTIDDKNYNLFLSIGDWGYDYRINDVHIVLGTNYKFGKFFSQLELSQALEDDKYIYIMKNLTKLAGEGAISRLNKGLGSNKEAKRKRRDELAERLNFDIINYDNNDWICISKIDKEKLENEENSSDILYGFLNNFIKYSFAIEEIILD